MTTDVNAFLATQMGARTAKFDEVGRTYKGEILAADVRQSTEFGSDKPEFWPDGKPKMEVVITLQTEEAEGDDDDGMRRVYAQGRMLRAISTAAKGKLEIGGKLAIKYTGDGEAKKGMNAPKLYKAWYEAPPPESVSLGSIDNGTDDEDDDAPF